MNNLLLDPSTLNVLEFGIFENNDAKFEYCALNQSIHTISNVRKFLELPDKINRRKGSGINNYF